MVDHLPICMRHKIGDSVWLVKFCFWKDLMALVFLVSNVSHCLEHVVCICFTSRPYVIDEDKIHAQIEENKKRPEKAKSKFRQKIDAAMKQAQEQQAQQKKKK